VKCALGRWWSFAEVPLLVLAFAACTKQAPGDDLTGLVGGATGSGAAGGTGGTGGSAAEGTGGDMMSTAATGGTGAMGGTGVIVVDGGSNDASNECPTTTCAALGVGCGKVVDKCGNVIDCALEGLTCGALEVCTGGVDMPATCVVGSSEPCDVCDAVPDCSEAAEQTTLTGRVVTPGRDDANAANQLGVPNAFVYVLRTKGIADLPEITTGIPEGGTSCDRCEDQKLGPMLVGTVTDATGAFNLSGYLPVGEEFTLVVKAGRFRRAINYTIPAENACKTTALPVTLPDNPTRLPRSMDDGLAVNIPRIAVSTGEVDAMECVLEKMGIAHTEFANPDNAAARVHLYRGGSDVDEPSGASIDTSTPHASELYGDAARLTSYDIVLSDCEGGSYDQRGTERDADGANVMQYVNRGGRLFASHLSFTWLDGNGAAAYDPADPAATGLAAAATWNGSADGNSNTGTGVVAVGRPSASPRIQNFADWMNHEMVAPAPAYSFNIIDPRSQAQTLGPSSEEFVFNSDVTLEQMGSPVTQPDDRSQQFSFNTPYGATEDAICGRVAYSGFHVAANPGDMTQSPFAAAIFPAHCVAGGDLTAQEKVLLYMLFDLAACVGETPPPPPCTPATCESLELKCGFSGDGCGDVLDCGPCPIPNPK
jgi:hypothetical protein